MALKDCERTLEADASSSSLLSSAAVYTDYKTNAVPVSGFSAVYLSDLCAYPRRNKRHDHVPKGGTVANGTNRMGDDLVVDDPGCVVRGEWVYSGAC